MSTKRREKISIVQFMQGYPSEEAARTQFEEWRWGNQMRCAHCDSVRICEAKNQKMPYRCKDCRKRFSPKTGTVMANSKLSYSTWLVAVYIAASGLRGTASTKLGSNVGCTQKSAWFLGQRISKALERDENVLSVVVEVDESLFGGKNRNKQKSKREGQRGPKGKQAVVGMKQRDGGVYAKAIPRSTATMLQSEISQHIKHGSVVYTGEHKAYSGLRGYEHKSEKHNAAENVREQIHTNVVESIWSLLKRGYYGTHHFISTKNIQRYASEIASIRSVSKFDAVDIMRVIVQGMIGQKLKYKELIR